MPDLSRADPTNPGARGPDRMRGYNPRALKVRAAFVGTPPSPCKRAGASV